MPVPAQRSVKDQLKQEIAELRRENSELRKENADLRSIEDFADLKIGDLAPLLRIFFILFYPANSNATS